MKSCRERSFSTDSDVSGTLLEGISVGPDCCCLPAVPQTCYCGHQLFVGTPAQGLFMPVSCGIGQKLHVRLKRIRMPGQPRAGARCRAERIAPELQGQGILLLRV